MSIDMSVCTRCGALKPTKLPVQIKYLDRFVEEYCNECNIARLMDSYVAHGRLTLQLMINFSLGFYREHPRILDLVTDVKIVRDALEAFDTSVWRKMPEIHASLVASPFQSLFSFTDDLSMTASIIKGVAPTISITRRNKRDPEIKIQVFAPEEGEKSIFKALVGDPIDIARLLLDASRLFQEKGTSVFK